MLDAALATAAQLARAQHIRNIVARKIGEQRRDAALS